MNLQIDRRANRIVLHCTGILDASGSREVEQAVQSLEEAGAVRLVLDLSAISSITNPGLDTLRRLFETMRHRGTESVAPSMLRLTNVPPRIQEALDESGFTEPIRGVSAESFSENPEAKEHFHALLSRVREAFRVPISDPLHDAYFVQSVARALDRVDQFKSGQPYLGAPLALNYEGARVAQPPEEMSSLETVIAHMADFLHRRPGWFTLETSRAGAAVLAALANLKLLGKEDYRVLLGHIVTMAEVLRSKLERAPYARVVNGSNHGTVTLFRVYPEAWRPNGPTTRRPRNQIRWDNFGHTTTTTGVCSRRSAARCNAARE